MHSEHVYINAPHNKPVRHISYESGYLGSSFPLSPQASQSNALIEIPIVPITNLSQVESYYLKENNTVILYIRSFKLARNETMDHFRDVLFQTIDYAKTRKCNQFIVSLHGNVGGSIECVYEFINLFWTRHESLSFSSSLVVDEMNQAFISNYINKSVLYPTIDPCPKRNDSDRTTFRNITVTGNAFTNYTTHTRLWTNRFVPRPQKSDSFSKRSYSFIPYQTEPFLLQTRMN